MSVNVKLITGEQIGVKLGSLHNSLFGLQGGSQTERFHLTESEVGLIHQNTGDIATISGLLNNDQLTDIVFQTGDQTISGVKSFDEDVVFNADINSAGNINQTGNYNISGDVSINGSVDAVGNITTSGTVNLHTAAFDTANGGPIALGEVAWDSTDGTLDLMADGNVKIAVGEDGLIRVRNTSDSIISKGEPLTYLGTNGASGKLHVGPWIGSNISNVRVFLGFAAGEIGINSNGYAVWFGKISEITTDGGDEEWQDGDIIYAVPGASATLTNIEPISGDYVTAAVVINAGSGTSGILFTRPTFDTVPPVIPSATQVEDYLVDDGIHEIISSSNTATPDAANGRSQKFPLTENVTLNTPNNLADGQSMTITIIQGNPTQFSLSLVSGFELMGGNETDIASIPVSKYGSIEIKRAGAAYLVWISTQS
jgi:hypothetical protein